LLQAVTLNPTFLALLHGRHVPTCVYCFDLLELNGRDLREQPLVQRRARRQALLARAKCNVIRSSEAFPDPNALLAECTRLGLEGCSETTRFALSIRLSFWLDKGQDPGVEGREQVPR
jgi:hypothetical protein